MPASPSSQPQSRLAQPDGLADMLLYRLHRLRAVGGGMVLRYCEGQFGVTRREWVMLALLASNGPVSPTELAALAALDKSATSKAVTGLLKKGLVIRQSRGGDRRCAQLALSVDGQALYGRIVPVVAGINHNMLSALTPGEVALLDDLLSRLQNKVEVIARDAVDLPLADRCRHRLTQASGRAFAEGAPFTAPDSQQISPHGDQQTPHTNPGKTD